MSVSYDLNSINASVQVPKRSRNSFINHGNTANKIADQFELIMESFMDEFVYVHSHFQFKTPSY